VLNNFTSYSTYFNFNVGAVQGNTRDVDLLATSGVALIVADALNAGVHSNDPAVIASEVTVGHATHHLCQTIPEKNTRRCRVHAGAISHDSVLGVVNPPVETICVFEDLLSVDQVLAHMQRSVRSGRFRGDIGSVSTSRIDVEVKLLALTHIGRRYVHKDRRVVARVSKHAFACTRALNVPAVLSVTNAQVKFQSVAIWFEVPAGREELTIK